MRFADYKCDNDECGNIITVCKIKDLEDFIPPKKCKECGGKKFFKKFAALPHDMGAGMCGNSETGYGTEITYKPSTKYGSFKTKR